MQQRAMDAEQLSAAVADIEDEAIWDAHEALDLSIRYEREATELGDELLVQRARLCQIHMQQRIGNAVEAAHLIWDVHRWAVEHDALELRSRTHMVWSSIHRMLGDSAQLLEHAVLGVELLSRTGTPYMQIWFRVKLADALAATGSMAAAREKYAQAEELCAKYESPFLLLWTFNNWAYSEYIYGAAPERAAALIPRLRSVAEQNAFEMSPPILDTIGTVQLANGRYAEAEQSLLECIRRVEAENGGYESGESLATYWLTLAETQRHLGTLERAQVSLDEGRRLCDERDLGGDVRERVHQEQAELHAVRGEFESAFTEYKAFIAANKAWKSSELEAQARTRQAMFETNEARQQAELFREQARRDPLTGLRNRRYADETLPALIDADPDLSVALVDLDHFKRINDQLSHDVGDQVLTRVARLLEEGLAAALPDGFAARLGGEEFLLVLPGTPAPAAVRVLDEIRIAIRRHDWEPITSGLPVTISAGLAGLADAHTRTQASLLSTADRHLYAAKRQGRDRVVAAPRDERTRTNRDLPPSRWFRRFPHPSAAAADGWP